MSLAHLLLIDGTSPKNGTTANSNSSACFNAAPIFQASVLHWGVATDSNKARYEHYQWEIFNPFSKTLSVPDGPDLRPQRLHWCSTQFYLHRLEPSLQNVLSYLPHILPRRRFRPLTAKNLTSHSWKQITRMPHSFNVLCSSWWLPLYPSGSVWYYCRLHLNVAVRNKSHLIPQYCFHDPHVKKGWVSDPSPVSHNTDKNFSCNKRNLFWIPVSYRSRDTVKMNWAWQSQRQWGMMFGDSLTSTLTNDL